MRWAEATVVAVQARTPRLRSLFLRAPGLARHVPGQHLDVRLVAEDGYEARRSYSIASAPADDGTVELAIEKLDDGEVSPWFHDVAAVGDTVEVLGPLGGHFTWAPGEPGPLLMVAGGSGIVPLVSMLRAGAAPARLLYSVRTWEDLAFGEELLAMPHVGLTVATTRGPRRRPQDIEGRFDASRIAAALSAWGEVPRRAYLCGATRFVETMANALVDAGIPAEAIRAERYGGA